MNSKLTLFRSTGHCTIYPNQTNTKKQVSFYQKAWMCLMVFLCMGMSNLAIANSTDNSTDFENYHTTASCDGKATDVWLVKSDRSREVRLTNGGSICRKDINFDQGFFRINTSGSVESMRIWVSGAAKTDNLENVVPYDSRAFAIVNGTYEVRVQLFSRDNGGGERLSLIHI